MRKACSQESDWSALWCCRVTLFETEETRWSSVSSWVYRKGFSPIDLSTCGSSKGCFRSVRVRDSGHCELRSV